MTAGPTGPSGPQFHQEHTDGERRSLRSYSPQSGVKDVDQYERALKWKAGTWSLAGGVLGALLSVLTGGNTLIYALVGWAVAFAGPLVIANTAARAAGGLYNPSGHTTPPTRQYSHAESLVVRGMYREGISAFERAIAEGNEDDPTPFLRIARTYRDHLEEFEDAARWFKKAMGASGIPPGLLLLTRKELVELYRVKMGQPEKAAPLLARLAAESAGTADGEWAARELAEVKAAMRADREEPDA